MRIMNEGALIVPAEAAGITVPKDTDNYSSTQYPHWNLYRSAQLGRKGKDGDEWHNAAVIAKLSVYDVENATWGFLIAKGFR